MIGYFYDGNFTESRPALDPRHPYAVVVSYDEVADNPREENDNMWTLAFTNNRYFGCGDHECDAEEERRMNRKRGWLCLPIYAYVHSAVAFSVGKFADPWDSGCCGYAYAKLVQWGRRADAARARRAINALKSELSEYQAYTNGEVYCLDIVDLRSGEPLYEYGCGGLYGWSAAEAEAEAMLKSYAAAHPATYQLPLPGLEG